MHFTSQPRVEPRAMKSWLYSGCGYMPVIRGCNYWSIYRSRSRWGGAGVVWCSVVWRGGGCGGMDKRGWMPLNEQVVTADEGFNSETWENGASCEARRSIYLLPTLATLFVGEDYVSSILYTTSNLVCGWVYLYVCQVLKYLCMMLCFLLPCGF